MGTKVVSADEARKNFAELLNSATYGNERIQIVRRGKVAGYITGPKDRARRVVARGGSSTGEGTPAGGGRVAVRPESAPIEEAILVDEEETVSWDELEEAL